MRFQLLYTVHRPLNRCSTCSSSSSSSTQPLREDNQLHRMHSTIRQPDSVCMSDYLGHSRKWKDNLLSQLQNRMYFLPPAWNSSDLFTHSTQLALALQPAKSRVDKEFFLRGFFGVCASGKRTSCRRQNAMVDIFNTFCH